MLKIFTTQLSGFLNRLYENAEFEMEDGARLLAQAAIGEGSIFIYGAHELEGVVAEALSGAEPMPSAKKLTDIHEVTSADRVLLFSRFSHDEDAVELAKQLEEKGIPTVAVSAITQEEEGLQSVVDVHINTNLKKPLVPTEDGERIGFPSLMLSVYVYHCLSLTLHEILSEY